MGRLRRHSSSDAPPAPPSERVYLAAFGKHPGWDDHIEDIGLETDHLAAVKRLLYVQGIAGNINAGAWDKLHDTQRAEGYDHLLVWRVGRDLVVARLWSSQDGKGRSRYPMVVCIQFRGMPLDVCLAAADETLTAAEARCKQTGSADGVRALMGELQEQLRRRVAEAMAEDQAEHGPPDLAPLLDAPALGPDRYGLRRILYQLIVQEPARADAGHPYLLRVPPASEAPRQAAERWLTLAASLLPPTAPVLAVVHLGRPWLDLIVGSPTHEEFYCLRATSEAIPLTSDVPYTLDEAASSAVDARIEALQAGPATQAEALYRTDRELPPEPVALLAGQPDAEAETVAEASVGRAWLKRPGVRWALAAAGAVLLLGLLIAVLLSLRGGGQRSGQPVGAGAGDGATGSSAVADGLNADRWGAFCRAYNEWFARLLGGLGPQRAALWKRDPNLAASLASLEAARADGVSLDPRSIAGEPGASIAELMTRPPASLATPETQRQLDRATAVVDRFREVLSGRRWAAVKDANELARRCGPIGLPDLASEFKALARSTRPARGADLAPAIDRLAAASEALAKMRANLSAINADAEAARGTGDPILSQLGSIIDERLQKAGRDGGMSAFRDELARLAGPQGLPAHVAAFAAGSWPRIDRDLLAADPPPRPADPEAVDSAALTAYVSALQSGRWNRPEEPDPRSDWAPGEALQRIAAGIESLQAKQETEIAGELAADLAALRRRVAEVQALPWNARTVETVRTRYDETGEALVALERRVGQARRVASRTREDYLSALPDRIAASPAINAEWTRRIEALKKDEPSLPRLREKTDALRAALAGLDAALPPALPASDCPPGARSKLLRLSAAARERAAEAALSEATGKDGTASLPAEPGELKSVKRYVAWRSDLATLVKRFCVIESLLRGGYALAEKPASGPALGALYEQAVGQPVWGEEAVRQALAPVAGRVEALDEVAALGRADLVARVRGLGDADREIRLAVWRALGRVDPPWPVGAREYELEEIAWSAAYAAARRIGDRRRAADLEAELNRGANRRWATCFNRLTRPADVPVVLGMGLRQGIKPAALAAEGRLVPAARYNLLLRGLRDRIETAGRDEEAIRSAIEAFLSGVGRLPDVLDRPAAQGLLAAVKALKDAAPGDPAEGGPAATGLGFAAGASPDRREVAFTWKPDGEGRTHKLTFRRLPAEVGALPVYLATEELTVGLMLDLLAAPGDRPKPPPLTDGDVAAEEDSRRGPRSWALSREGKRYVAEEWLYWLADAPAYPEDSAPAAPTARTPAQYVSLAAAAWLARRAGCRLPSAGELQAAMKLPRPASRPNNRRDPTWARQRDYASMLERCRKVRLAPYPDADILLATPAAERAPTGADAREVDATRDGYLWFAPVPAGGSSTWAHLVGNVAEWYCDGDESVQDRLAAGRPVDVAVGAIGASALSPPEVAPNVPQPLAMRNRLRGYSDVGLRLAFTAPGEPMDVRAARLLANPPYLPAR